MSSSMRLLHPSVSNLGGVRVCRPSDAAADLKSMPTNNNERSCIGWGVKAGLLGRIKLSLQWIRRATFSLSIYGYISRPFSIIFFHIGPELTHADQRAETSPIYPSTDPPTSCPPLSFFNDMTLAGGGPASGQQSPHACLPCAIIDLIDSPSISSIEFGVCTHSRTKERE